MKLRIGDADLEQDFEIETDDIDIEKSVALIKEDEADGNDMEFPWEQFNSQDESEKRETLGEWAYRREIWYYDAMSYVKFVR